MFLARPSNNIRILYSRYSLKLLKLSNTILNKRGYIGIFKKIISEIPDATYCKLKINNNNALDFCYTYNNYIVMFTKPT